MLMAVALFTGLSYVVIKSSRSGAPGVREKDMLNAASLLDFTSQIRVAVSRLKVLNGVRITDIKFNNDVYQQHNGTMNFSPMGNPADPRLYVFHSNGGGVPPRTFEDLSAPCPACTGGALTKPGHIRLQWTNIPDVGTAISDPAIFLVSLKKDVCSAVNKRLGVSGIPVIATIFYSDYPGAAFFPVLQAVTGSDAAKIRGRSEFCFSDSQRSRYIFVSVIDQY
ncbi:hypothetical protein BJF93_05195 [Xaviernesmea oryzae]|uniref:Uncharacterized protein n=1 Tax=Xaviernesmea oryzae TaxID=464029 RepID=A0A1Q9AV04_9HYPH|nr:hypothetical protein [Xaviernesmea oryzae]OLP59280.1 hypothetical protein BJF93_05195 [Xaviernesmea oryzae]SEK78257.1 hypothetical protein SAMN04487976_1045 [Xaviernesmea oryzae]